MQFHHYLPTRVLFGPGQVHTLHSQALPGKKALIVISNGTSAKTNGYLDTVARELEQAGVSHVVFGGVQPNPTRENVMDGARTAREHNCDFIIALGGGSPMDAAKAIAAMATNDGDVWDYISGGTGKGLVPKTAPLPLIAITTTAGTGSEADAWGVITKEDAHEKIGFGGLDSLFPVLSIVDPELMRSVPPALTAYQGFDALFHSVECYLSKAANLMSDMYAITAIRAIGRHLERAVRDGSDMEARTQVAFGNTLGGFAMTVGSTTSQHSLEHALSAAHPALPHGAGLIMISRAYFTHFAKTGALDERMIAMAKAMGKENAACALDFVDALVDLQTACGVDQLKMSDYGIQKEELPGLARNARVIMPGLFACDSVPLSDEESAAILVTSYR